MHDGDNQILSPSSRAVQRCAAKYCWRRCARELCECALPAAARASGGSRRRWITLPGRLLDWSGAPDSSPASLYWHVFHAFAPRPPSVSPWRFCRAWVKPKTPAHLSCGSVRMSDGTDRHDSHPFSFSSSPRPRARRPIHFPWSLALKRTKPMSSPPLRRVLRPVDSLVTPFGWRRRYRPPPAARPGATAALRRYCRRGRVRLHGRSRRPTQPSRTPRLMPPLQRLGCLWSWALLATTWPCVGTYARGWNTRPSACSCPRRTTSRPSQAGLLQWFRTTPTQACTR